MAKAKTPVKTVKRPHGRPSKYTAEIAQEICDRMEAGEPLLTLCRDEHMPSARQVYEWAKNDLDGFSSRLAGARDAWHDSIAYRVRDTARGIGDSQGDVVRDRLIIETDLKLLACWDRARYGTTRIETEQKVSVEIKDLDQAKNEVASLLGAFGA